ncbi:MAG TPA: ROK family protein [Patescibacteria group bacterium]|jgi:glucokinase|nr:ROK family protein [Patescibacteria group bacterium]
MYLSIDIGGTKTLVAALDNNGVIQERQKFPTPPGYEEWCKQLAQVIGSFSAKEFIACGVGVPGRIDRANGIGLDMGNLIWHDVPVKKDVTNIVHCPVVVDNDANLAGLSEAMLVKDQYQRVLYVTISTGIGTGIIIDQKIDPSFADSEGGHMVLEHNGKLEEWEKFASGQAINRRFGKKASEITDPETWRIICKDIALGLNDLIAVVQPEVIILGGGVGTYYDRYKDYLKEALAPYETPLVPLPDIKQAGRPEDAVAYGCYDLAKSVYGTSGT